MLSLQSEPLAHLELYFLLHPFHSFRFKCWPHTDLLWWSYTCRALKTFQLLFQRRTQTHNPVLSGLIKGDLSVEIINM
jgi:hypothetical protein